MDGIPKLKGYKNTKKAKKIESAQKIVKYFNSKKIEVDAIGIVSKTNGQFVHWACDSINRARTMLNASWEVEGTTPTYLNWNGSKIPRTTILGLCIYANIMSIMALKAETLVAKEPTQSFKLCLDALPNNSNLGMSFMEALSQENEIASMWKQNMKSGASFEVGVFDKWLGKDKKWHPGKKHPNSILVDWMVVSCMAKVNPKQLKTEGGYTDEEIEKIAGIWDAAFRKSIIDVDDEDYIKNVKNHAATKNTVNNETNNT